MVFKNFFKKFGSSPEAVELEVINFDSIDSWIERKQTEIDDKVAKLFFRIKEKVKNSVTEISESVKKLRDFDLDSKREDERYKLIVRKHRGSYIDNVQWFLNKLENLEEEKRFKDLVDKVDGLFSAFEKRSHVDYERATILIGKEMADIRQNIISLSKYLRQLFKDNKELVDVTETIEDALVKLEELKNLEKNYEKLVEERDSLKKEAEKTAEKNKDISEKLSRAKISRDYKGYLEQKQKLVELEKEIERDISKLRADVDFKGLTSFFHSSEKEMKIIKRYKENFHENFNLDNGKEIVRLVKESNINSERIVVDINKILDKKKREKEIKDSLGEDSTKPLLREIQRLEEVNRRLKRGIENMEKVIENVLSKKEDLISRIKDKLRNFVVIEIE